MREVARGRRQVVYVLTPAGVPREIELDGLEQKFIKCRIDNRRRRQTMARIDTAVEPVRGPANDRLQEWV